MTSDRAAYLLEFGMGAMPGDYCEAGKMGAAALRELASLRAVVEAAKKARASAHVCFLWAADLMQRAGPELLSATEIQTLLKDSAVAHADSDAWVAALANLERKP